MFHPSKAVWAAFYYSIALSAICVVTDLASYALTGTPAVSLQPFLCFLPMAFMFAGYSLKQSQDNVNALEARIRLLEASKSVNDDCLP